MSYLSRYDVITKYDGTAFTLRFVDKWRKYPSSTYLLADIKQAQATKLQEAQPLLLSILGSPLTNWANIPSIVEHWVRMTLDD